MKKIVLLGGSGSIGKSTIALVRKNPDKFKIVGISGHSRFESIEKIAQEFNILHTLNTAQSHDFPEFLKKCEADIVLNAVVGFAGLKFSIEILNQKIPLALANKESLVAGGDLLMNLSIQNKTPILPVDSEHSAIFDCLSPSLQSGSGNIEYAPFHKILLTCSGGPFWGKTWEDLQKVTPSQALKHPNWDMGAKISIDSATLANKCLEFFEAMHLFGATKDQIEIIIHRESIVHSMVEFEDSSILSQIAPPNMELPIAMALNYPQKSDYKLPRQSFDNLNLSFYKPDKSVFKTLQILDICAEQKQSLPLAFNAANEVLVEAFLQEKIKFTDIFDSLEQIITKTKPQPIDSFDQILYIDSEVRNKTHKLL